MNPNETIGKWAVEKGLLDCWHDSDGEMGRCSKCSMKREANPDYSIYENMAPVLDYVDHMHGGCFAEDLIVLAAMDCRGKFIDLPPTLRDMVAELISKGEV